MIKKLSLICCLFLLSFTLSAESFANQLLKKSDFTVQYAFSVNTGKLSNYAKLNNSIDVRIGTELYALPNNLGTAGLSTTYSYTSYLLKREEFRQFYGHSITENVWFNFYLPKNFSILVDLGGGLQITKVDALNIHQSKLEDYYNAAVVSLKAVVSNKILNAGPVAFFWNGGVKANLIIEKDSLYPTFGAVVGISIKEAK